MNIFYTKTYNTYNDTIKKQTLIEQVSRELGYEEISLFKFDDSYDSDTELDTRMESIVSPVCDGDAVIFQYPGAVSARYDAFLIKHLLYRKDLKLIIFVEDIGSKVFPDNYPSLEDEINIFNSASVLILQSEEMYRFLFLNGLSKNLEIVLQEIWEYPYNISFVGSEVEKRREEISNFSIDFLLDNNKPGIAILDEFQNIYLQMSGFFKTGICICKGIPIICKTGSITHRTVSKYGLGFGVNSMDEALSLIDTLKPWELTEITNRCKTLAPVVSKGIFTKKLLMDSICISLAKLATR